MSSAPRTALQYILLFGTSGVTLPFAGLWFRSQGMSGAEIGALLALPMFGRIVSGPLLAVWADGFRLRRTAIALLGLAMVVGYGAAGLVDNFYVRALCWFVGATAAAALIPLSDVLTLRLSRRENYPFSLPRGCGSLAFVVANIGMGALLTIMSADIIIVWIVSSSALIALTAWLCLPAEPVQLDGVQISKLARFQGLGRLAKNRTFVCAILGIGAVQAAHGFYYGFSAIAWKAQGISESMTGLLWAFAVAVEIGFMWVVEPWRKRKGFGAFPLLMVGVTAAVIRWLFMALEPSFWWLWPLQAMHALTFAATYLAGVEIVEALSPPQDHTAAQTLSSVVAAGFLIGLATAVSGQLYDAYGAQGYMAMAVLAALGGVFAVSVRRPIISALG
ncbi:MFS transporter [Brevundimonas sp.]|uniref:MFS transporter n=1 Tax=Brevundimonas sp. TaxID=1871086 RepID=UPI00289E8878|nr:MFS transporter [Brevundimonas sp.]